MGRNIGYGGAAPRVPGSLIIDLGRRMNKVLNIDGSSASCMVEPGVSYYKLYEEVQKTVLPLWIDCPDLVGESVMDNALDRGVGYAPYGDHFSKHCGMEIVLPSGELLRTGMGAMPGKDGADNPTWQSFQTAYGPYSDGIFSQSNYGIVTRMGFWLMPATNSQSYMITFPREDDFSQIVEIIKPFAQQGLFANIPQLRHVIQEIAVQAKPKIHYFPGRGRGRMARSELSRVASTLPCGDCSWVFYGCQYGEHRHSQIATIREAFSTIEGSRIIFPTDVPPDHYLHSRTKVFASVPVLREIDWLNWVPNAAHLFFAPITPTRGSDVWIVHDIISALHEKWGFDLFPTLVVAGREMHYLANIVYDRGDDDAKQRAEGGGLDT